MIPNDLRYEFSSGAYLLLGTVLLFIILWNLYFYRKKSLHQFGSTPLLEKILTPRSRYNYWFKTMAFCLTWVLATLALMRPIGNGHYPFKGILETKEEPKERETIIKRKKHEIIFLIDASASMAVDDTRTHVSRLEFAKEIIDEIIAKLQGENIALYAFTSEMTKLSPPTMDYLFVRLMLKETQINEGDAAGTNISNALTQIKKNYLSKLTPVYKTIILLTDGGDNKLETLQGSEKDKYIHAQLKSIEHAEENRLRVYTIGLGTSEGKIIPNIQYENKPVLSSLDEGFLKKISRTGRGKFYLANEWNTKDLAADIVTDSNRQESSIEEYTFKKRELITKGEQDLVYDLFFQIPLGIAIFLLGVALVFPDTRERKEL